MKIALLAATFLCALSSCVVPRVDATANYGQLSIDGKIGVEANAVDGTTDLSTLGLDEDSSVPSARVDLDWVGVHLSVSYLASDFSGSGTTSSEFSQTGVVIPVGANVQTTADVDVLSGVATFDLIPGDSFELGLGLGATAVNIAGSIDEVGGPNTIDIDEVLPIPLIGLRAGVDLGQIEFEGVLSGMDLSVDGDSLRVVDADVAALWRFLGGEDRLSLALRLGYRYLDIEADYADGDDNVVLELGADGPYLGLTVGF